MDILKLDRRFIFILMAVVILVPMLLNITSEVEVGQDTRKAYEAIDTLKAGDFIMISFDFEASAFPEMRPLAETVLRHAFRKDLRVVGLALFSEGTVLGYTLLTDLAKQHGKRYGQDYIYLGFRPQFVSAILGMGESIRKVFPEDYLKRPLSEYPAFAGLVNYGNLPLVISVADGSLPIHWADYANARYHQRVAVACAASMVTAFKPYFESGQLIGPVAGARGAAEYEKLLGYKGPAHRRLSALTAGHLAIIAIVIATNLVAFKRRKR